MRTDRCLAVHGNVLHGPGLAVTCQQALMESGGAVQTKTRVHVVAGNQRFLSHSSITVTVEFPGNRITRNGLILGNGRDHAINLNEQAWTRLGDGLH